LNCHRLDAPIVLAHGLFGFDRIGLGRLTLASYFRGIPEFLRLGGNRVLVTRVPSIAGVKARSRALAEEIERVFPGLSVHVIGHSMGGLDTRQLLADRTWSARILTLTTIGTPHLGSALADCARLKVGRVYHLLRRLGVEYRGFLDVTRRAARAVNRNGCIPVVPTFCVAGDPLEEQLCWPLRPFYEILHDLEGPNDGLVPVESALGFGTPLPIWPVDHFRQMNWLPAAGGISSSDKVLGLYAEVVANLAALGFSAGEPLYDSGACGLGRWLDPSSKHDCRVFVMGPIIGFPTLPGRPIQQDGDCHVAQDVGGGAAAVHEPVDREEHGDLISRQADGGEDER
jgi:triacylglycerol lipase